jgi:hypothetical protein
MAVLAAGAAAGRGDVDKSSSVGWGSSFGIAVAIFVISFAVVWIYMSRGGR